MRRLVFDQSSPVHLVSEPRGGEGTVSMTNERRTEILVSNFGFMGALKFLKEDSNVLQNKLIICFLYTRWEE